MQNLEDIEDRSTWTLADTEVRSNLKLKFEDVDVKAIEIEQLFNVEDGYVLYWFTNLEYGKVIYYSNRLYCQIIAYIYSHRCIAPHMIAVRTRLMLERSFHRAHDFKVLFLKYMLLDFSRYRYYSSSDTADQSLSFHSNGHYGGGVEPVKKRTWSSEELQVYTLSSVPEGEYQFIDYIPTKTDIKLCIEIPLDVLINRLNAKDLKNVGIEHHVSLWTRKYISLTEIQKQIREHNCNDSGCISYYSVFELKKSKPKTNASRIATLRETDSNYKVRDQERCRGLNFPPTPPSKKLITQIIQDFCAQCDADTIEEVGCAVCGQLKKRKKIEDLKVEFDVLENDQVTRKLCTAMSDPILFFKGPVLDDTCHHVCSACVHSLQNGKASEDSLSNGLWLGTVPPELKDLSWTEKLLVAQVMHNYCVIRVASSGSRNLKANAICHSIPTPKIYSMLPPLRKDLDLVLSCIFIGPSPPTAADYKRTPFLVRHNKVAAALEWLKLNHIDYADVGISYKNLKEYSESEPPVQVIYQKSEDAMKEAESSAVNDTGDEEATSEGQCPFVVHGLTGEQLTDMMKQDPKKITAKAIQHGHTLGIGQSDTPESLYDNPQLYPQMFPWLFPYGLGGIGNNRGFKTLTDAKHKKWLLMYHDKHFQLDPTFCLIAWNQQQIKNSVTGGYLLAQKKSFGQISDRLLNLNDSVLQSIIERLEKDGHMRPETPQEKECFRILNDLDFVNAKVDGSTTSKRYMRNEIWSMINSLGAPSWFITFSPADINHPIALYFADTQETFNPIPKAYNDRVRLIANNPIAGARFFHFMVKLFLRHVLGVGSDHRGLYGDTAGYYGTVEQQGRLTLHMHMLVWIVNCLTPQEIRDKILDPKSTFQQRIIEYLESVHMGEFTTGTMADVEERLDKDRQHKTYVPATETLPTAPPTKTCKSQCGECENCFKIASW